MFTLTEPSAVRIEDFLREQKDLPFSYPEVGASRDSIPQNYPINHRRARLGDGAEIFDRAKNAVREWAMYQTGWTKIYPTDAPVAVGTAVVVVVNHGFCWSLNSCRIVYVLEESGAVKRFGFAFGTLLGHSESGEERFTVEWRRDDDAVFYELMAFARPHHILAKIGFPFVRWSQRKFAEDSRRAMLKAIGND